MPKYVVKVSLTTHYAIAIDANNSEDAGMLVLDKLNLDEQARPYIVKDDGYVITEVVEYLGE